MSPRSHRLPGGLTPEEERAILAALERYFLRENPRPDPWVLAGRTDTMGLGALQARRLMDAPWGSTTRTQFARRGAPSFHGRADCR